MVYAVERGEQLGGFAANRRRQLEDRNEARHANALLKFADVVLRQARMFRYLNLSACAHARRVLPASFTNLMALLDILRSEGCTVDDKTDTSEFGKFGWVMDPEGNRIELREPPKGRFPG